MSLADSIAYQAALEAAGIVPGDKVGIAYRSVPAIPVQGDGGKPTLMRMRNGVTLVGFNNGHIIYKHDNGMITVDPLSEVFVEKPSVVTAVSRAGIVIP